MALGDAHGLVRVWFVVAAASLGLACGSYEKHAEPGPPPLPRSSGTANGATAAKGGTGASDMPIATNMMIATGAAGTSQASASTSAAGADVSAEAGTGGSGMSAAVSGSGGGGSLRGAGAGGIAGASGRGGAGGDSGASGSDDGDQNPDRDVTGPCSDLNLFCVDELDMFLLNPECFTCNDGAGCQSCQFFRAI